MQALLGIGANLDRPTAQIHQALDLLATRGLQVVCCSRLAQCAAVGGPPGQPPFVNGAAVVETDRSVVRLAEDLQAVEREVGRVRTVRWGPRRIDLDLLLLQPPKVVAEPWRVPHPRMAFRPFVVAPAAQIAGDWYHPVLQQTVQQLWQHLQQSDRAVWMLPRERADLPSEIARRIEGSAEQAWRIVTEAPADDGSSILPRLGLRLVRSPLPAPSPPLSLPDGRLLPTIDVVLADLNESRISDIVAMIHGTETPLNWLSVNR